MIFIAWVLVAIAAAIVAVVAAKRTRSEARKEEEAALMSQRLEDLYRAATEAQIDPGRVSEARQQQE